MADSAHDPDGGQQLSPPRRIVLTRRRFLAQAGALVAAGFAAGLAGTRILETLLVTRGRRDLTPGLGSGAIGASLPPAGASLSPGPLGPGVSATPQPIQAAPAPGPARARRENLRTGTTAWELPLGLNGSAAAYATDTSVAEGNRLEINVGSAQDRADITLYRLGWYGGAGGRVVAGWKGVPIQSCGEFTTDPTSGMIRCAWAPAVGMDVPDSWVSGLYLAVVAPLGGAPQYCHVVVRESTPTAPILFVSSASTHQAYNNWGGKSLYPDESTGAKTISGSANAVIASWDRPYADLRGAGLVLRWEYPFVRWLESRGYDVAYAVDLDLERAPSIVNGRRLLVFVGHPEYWSVGMRQTLEAAIAAGTNVAMFSADEIYWRVRYEDGAGGRYRTVTCYRSAAIDPLAATQPAVATTKWRDPPTRQPESLLIGQMYGHVVRTPAAYVCTAPDHWIYEGTGMVAGDSIPNLVGQEYDRVFASRALQPPGLQILATSPVTPVLSEEDIGGASRQPNPPVHNATIYTAASGATVVSLGTMQWSWALDDWGAPTFAGQRTPIDPRVDRITTNILDRLSL